MSTQLTTTPESVGQSLETAIVDYGLKMKETNTITKLFANSKQAEKWKADLVEKLKVLVTTFEFLDSISEDDQKLGESQNWDTMVTWLRDSRQLRIQLDGERKQDKSVVKNVSDSLEAIYSSPIDFITQMEEKIKPIRKKIEAAEEEEKRKKKEEAELKFTKRIDQLLSIGAKLIDGYYEVTNIESPDESVKIQAIDIRNTSDDIWQTITDRVTELNNIRLAHEAKEKEEKEAEENKIKEEKEKLTAAKLQLENDRYEMRKESLETLGFNALADGSYGFDNKAIVITKNEIVSLENWKDTLDGVKHRIQELSYHKKLRHNEEKILQLGFIKTEHEYKNNDLRLNFGFSIKHETILSDKDTDDAILDFQSNLSKAIEAKSKEDDLMINRSEILKSIGMSFAFKDQYFYYNFKQVSDPIIIKRSDLISWDEVMLTEKVSQIKSTIESDIQAYELLLKEETEKQTAIAEAKRIATESDKANLVELAEKVSLIQQKYDFKSPEINKAVTELFGKLYFGLGELFN